MSQRRTAKQILTARANAIDDSYYNADRRNMMENTIIEEMHFKTKQQNKPLYSGYSQQLRRYVDPYLEREASHVGKGILGNPAGFGNIYRDYDTLQDKYVRMDRDIRMRGGCEDCLLEEDEYMDKLAEDYYGKGQRGVSGDNKKRNIYKDYGKLQEEYVDMPRDYRMREAGGAQTDMSIKAHDKAIKDMKQGKKRKNQWLDFLAQEKKKAEYNGLSYKDILKKASANYKRKNPKDYQQRIQEERQR